MTIEVPPTTTTETESPTVLKPIVLTDENKQVEAQNQTETEATLLTTAEEIKDKEVPTEEKPTSGKKRNLFNNPFGKGSPKKEEAGNHEEEVHKEPVEDATKTAGENKITKSLGNIYTKIKVHPKYICSFVF